MHCGNTVYFQVPTSPRDKPHESSKTPKKNVCQNQFLKVIKLSQKRQHLPATCTIASGHNQNGAKLQPLYNHNTMSSKSYIHKSSIKLRSILTPQDLNLKTFLEWAEGVFPAHLVLTFAAPGTQNSSFHFLFHYPIYTPYSIYLRWTITPIHTLLQYSSFHFLFHYPNMTPIYNPWAPWYCASSGMLWGAQGLPGCGGPHWFRV